MSGFGLSDKKPRSAFGLTWVVFPVARRARRRALLSTSFPPTAHKTPVEKARFPVSSPSLPYI